MWSFALLKGLGVPGYPDTNGTFSRTGHGFPLPYKVTVDRWNGWFVGLLNPVSQFPCCLNVFHRGPTVLYGLRRLKDPTVPRYMIVRHPHARLLSGYLGKVLKRPNPAIWPQGYNSSSGFAGFVQAVTRARTLDGHFTLMAHHCGISTGMSYRVLRGEVRLYSVERRCAEQALRACAFQPGFGCACFNAASLCRSSTTGTASLCAPSPCRPPWRPAGHSGRQRKLLGHEKAATRAL